MGVESFHVEVDRLHQVVFANMRARDVQQKAGFAQSIMRPPPLQDWWLYSLSALRYYNARDCFEGKDRGCMDRWCKPDERVETREG